MYTLLLILNIADAKLIFGLIIFFILFEIFCISFLLISPIIVKVKGDTLVKRLFNVDINFSFVKEINLIILDYLIDLIIPFVIKFCIIEDNLIYLFCFEHH